MTMRFMSVPSNHIDPNSRKMPLATSNTNLPPVRWASKATLFQAADPKRKTLKTAKA